MLKSKNATRRHASIFITSAMFVICVAASSQLHADIFNDLVNIVVDDLAAGETVASATDVMPEQFDIELEHSGAGGFDVDITPLIGCDIQVRIGHFAPIEGIAIGPYDWQITDIHMRDDDGDIMFAKITGIEFPDKGSHDMPTVELFFTDWVVSCRTGAFPSKVDGAFNDYIVRIAVIGDVNKDCEIDLLDVEPFIEQLGNGGYSVEADINQDGLLNLLDVGEFVGLLSE